MKQILFLLAFVLLITDASAQVPYFPESNGNLIPLESKTYTVQASYQSADEIVNQFVQSHQILSNPTYQLTDAKTVKSLTGTHYTFNLTKDGIQIHDAQLKIHTDLTGKVIRINDNIPSIQAEPGIEASSLNKANRVWVNTIDGWVLAQMESDETNPTRRTIKHNGQTIHSFETKHFYRGPDTLTSAHVFMVNPLNTAQKPYGSPYVDSSDADFPLLNNERKWATMPAWFENDTFILKTDRYYIGHVADPVTPKTYALTDTFDFTRHQYQFEDVNAFYHITAMSDYVEDLGFETALPDTLLIDAHGYNGSDASSFNYDVHPLELEFGEGGVDDAEDGEIVVHEYAHALAHIAGGDSYSDTRDRAAMEEGNADYFSASYSKVYTDYAWQLMFNWDGHNPFWEGIHIGTIKTYPKDMLNSTNEDREMWSTPLMCIYDRIGRGPTDSLVLEHLYYQFKGATIPEMAEILVDIDSMLWKGKYESDIRGCFAKHDILSSVPSSPVFAEYFEAFGTSGFSTGQTNAEIRSRDGQPFSYLVYDALGQTISQGEIDDRLILDPQAFISGIYFVELKKGSISAYLKILKN